MRKLKKKIDVNKRKVFDGFSKLIYLSLFERFNKNFLFFPFNKTKYLMQYCVKNRCGLTGRGRSVSRRYKLSRMQLKNFIYLGYFPGVKRSS
jgi:ribosomal protein S14